MKCIAVLGGSNPFTLALVEALRVRAHEFPRLELVLHGRNEEALALVGACASSLLEELGWRVRTATRFEEVLPGADFVIQQIRFDGLRGRELDEEFARSTHCAIDETIGAAALRRMLSTSERVQQLGATIAELAPQARVLNLTNPLSLTTSLIARAGVRSCHGLCELPETTASRAAALLGADPEGIEFDYIGLNHRGFIVRLEGHGMDLLGRMIEKGMAPSWTDIHTVRSLVALPTKYFRLALGEQDDRSGSGRARELAILRADLFVALRADTSRLPARLAERTTDWYERAVVPILLAMCGAHESVLVLNHVGADGVTREGKARVFEGGVEALPRVRANAAVETWVARFEEHERRMLALLEFTCERTLRHAIEADCGIPADRRASVLDALLHDGILPAEVQGAGR